MTCMLGGTGQKNLHLIKIFEEMNKQTEKLPITNLETSAGS